MNTYTKNKQTNKQTKKNSKLHQAQAKLGQCPNFKSQKKGCLLYTSDAADE